jgi:transcriptional repressor NrdR
MALGSACPYCNSAKHKVLEVRSDKLRGMTKRRRECLDCGSRWSTYEVEADRLDLLEDAVKRNAV